MSEAEINEIVARWEKYIEENSSEQYEPTCNTLEAAPVYTPLPRSAGPKPITIEQYKKKYHKTEIIQEPSQKKTKKKRAGKKFQKRKEIAILYRELILATTTEPKKLINHKIKYLKYKK